MKTALRRLGTALVGIALVGGGVAVMGEQAYADTPAAAITSDPNASMGTLAFYDASGNQITSGSTNSLQYTYAVASAPKDRAVVTGQKAVVYYALPDHTQTDSQNWFSGNVTASTLYPVTTVGAPANITSVPSNTPVNSMKAGDQTLSAFLTTGVMDTTAGYNNFVQVRLFDLAPGQAQRTAPFYASVIQIDPTAHTWTQVYPAVVQKTATAVSTITPSPASPATHGSTVTLTATVTAADNSHPAGSVHLFDGNTDLGAATFDATTGAITKTDTPADGAHSYKYVFTPSDTATYTGNQSAVLSYTVNPATATSTTLTANPAATAEIGTSVTLTATINQPAHGTVQFKDGSTNIGSPVTVTVGASSATASTSWTAASPTGAHSLTAVFTSSDLAFLSSTSAALSYTVQPHPATSTATALSVSPASPSTFGDTVTLTGTVSPSNAQGTVHFFDGTTDLGSQTWNGAPVAIATSSLAVGSHSLTAQFQPNDAAVFGQSTSTPATAYTVNPVTTTTTLDPVVPTVNYGSNSTFTASVSPATAVGSIQFKDGSANLGSPVGLSSGSAGLNVVLNAGSHAITAHYVPANANYSGSSSAPQTVTVNPAATATSVTGSPTPSTFGQAVTFTASVLPSAADGNVQFAVDGTPTGGPVALSASGQASYMTSSLVSGNHTITATYNPGASGNYVTSTGTVSQTVTKATTTTSVTTNPASNAPEGASVTITATVNPAQAGQVTFADGSTTLGSAPVANGHATLTTSSLTTGAHSLTATFAPTDTANVDGSTSSAVALNIVPATTTTLTVPASPVDFGASVTLTAAVDPTNAAGSIKFVDGTTVLATVPVLAGSASYTVSALDSGVHSLTAQFVPSDPTAWGTSTSGAQSLTIKPQVTSVTLSVSPNTSPVVQGKSVTIAAVLAPTSAAGTVTFADNGIPLLTHAVSGGAATFTSTTFKVGDHSVSATFTPTSATKFVSSTSTTPATFTIVAKPIVTDCTDASGKVIAPGATLRPGAKFTLHASGFVAEESATAELHSKTIALGTFTAAQDGTVTVPVALPSTLAAGSHTVTITGQRGTATFAFKVASASQSTDVTPSTGGNNTAGTPSTGTNAPVPNTGAVVKPPLFIGLGAIFVGLALIGYARPRRRRS